MSFATVQGKPTRRASIGTMVLFGHEAAKRSARQWRRLGSLAGRFLQLVEGLPTLRAFGSEDQGRREVAAATDGVRIATTRTLA